MATIQYDVYSHNFAMTGFDALMHATIMEYVRAHLTQFGMVPVGYNRFERKPIKVFAARLKDKSVYRFHVNHFEEFKRFMESRGHRNSIVNFHEIPPGADVDLKTIDGKKPYEEQLPVIQYVVEDGKIKIVVVQTGRGKAQPLDAKIKVPGGWKRMGDIQVADIVTAKDGTQTRVTGVFPQGIKDIYRIRFSDDRATECCGEHLWKIYKHSWGGPSQVVSTLEMIRLIRKNSNHEIFINFCQSEDAPTIDLPMDPYEYGISIKKEIACPTTSISEIYLNASTRQRLDLLAGIMPAEWVVSGESGGGIIGVSERLALDVQYLIRSLGGWAYVGASEAPDTGYGVTFALTQQVACFNGLDITSIEHIGQKEAQCISIDHPDQLYVTDEFIVTHNTRIALEAACIIRKRLVLIVRGMYVERWLNDFKAVLGLKPGEILIVRGSKDLKNLIALARCGELKAKAIIITNRTLYFYFAAYEEFNGAVDLYDCSPVEFFGLIGAGWRIIDEVHLDFHLNYKIDLYSNIPKILSLTATFVNDNRFITEMYEIAYPKPLRYTGLAYKKYIRVKALMYSMNNPGLVKFMSRMRMYSHVKFEESIIKNKPLLQRYLDMINRVVYETFVTKMKFGQKMIVFCATIEMCTLVQQNLKSRYSDIYVGRYVEEDKYEDLLTSDITVSTLLSAGTAVDVPGLRVVLMTTAISSVQANEQGLGRLRELKDWPDTDPEFYYFVCEDIPKHIDYHNKKKEDFDGKVLSHQELWLDTKL